MFQAPAGREENPSFRRERAGTTLLVDAFLHRRDTYLKIKAKIKHLQKLKSNIFQVNIKHSLDKKFSKIAKIEKKFRKILRKFGFRAVQRVLNLVDLKKC